MPLPAARSESELRIRDHLADLSSYQLQYGFHISALNSTQDSIICGSSNRPLPGLAGAPTCVTMTTFGFGVVTAAFTLGGFFSSVVTGSLCDRVGRKRTAVYSAWLIILVSSGRRQLVVGELTTVEPAGRVGDDLGLYARRSRRWEVDYRAR